MKIISTKKYNALMLCKEELDMYRNNNLLMQKIDALEKNNNHKDNMMTILKKQLENYKAEICKLRIELEDKQAYLDQEKQVSSALRKQREIRTNTSKTTVKRTTKKNTESK